MWTFRAHNKLLYWSLLSSSAFLMIVALGPGLFSSSASSYSSWQFSVFDMLCHQDPLRSFSLSGVQMAVCARCLGIYSALLSGWIFMPFYALLRIKSKTLEKNWLIAAIILNLADVLGNYFGIWTNTLTSRFILGLVFGFPLAFILVNEFFKTKKSEK